MGLEPSDEGGVSYGNGGDITKDTDLNGFVVNNMYYSIGTDAGGYDEEEGCIVITISNVIAGIGTDEAKKTAADLNGDNVVNIADIIVLVNKIESSANSK